MTKKIKRKVFSSMAEKFENKKMKEYFLDMCEEIPDYVFTMPASTSGKYHNKQQCEKHGQIIHVFMFSYILENLINLEHNKKLINSKMRDAMRCVPAFHDAVKCGWYNGSKHTVWNHPMLAYEWVLNTHPKHDIDDETRNIIANMCAAHSGEWNKDREGNPVMPLPSTTCEKIIHECDILSSRKELFFEIPMELLEILHEDI